MTRRKDSREFLPWSLHNFLSHLLYMHNACKRERENGKKKRVRGTVTIFDDTCFDEGLRGFRFRVYVHSYFFSLHNISRLSIFSLHLLLLLHTTCTHHNRTEDEKQNQKGNNPRKKAFSCSQLLPLGLGLGAIIWGCWGCMAKMLRPCASRKKGVSLSETTNLSEAEIEYVGITVLSLEQSKNVPRVKSNKTLIVHFCFLSRCLISMSMAVV
jgi:hypothetical protein